ncbi:hypothetical protein BD779DRAFT_1671825 [Infundibulicybe gibba]|nr:hypothetical protein BD779DRAFT_1671825 [Infundibulicybe gibba]
MFESLRSWLESNLAGFLDARDSKRVDRFLHSLYERWFAEFPEVDVLFPCEPDVPRAELTDEQKVELTGAVLARKAQIRNWMNWNAIKRTRTSLTPDLSLFNFGVPPDKHTRAPQEVEVYQKMFPEKVAKVVKQATAGAGNRSERMSIQRKTVNALLEQEDEDVREAINEQLMRIKGERRAGSDDSGREDKVKGPSPIDYHKYDLCIVIQKLPEYVRHTLEAAAASTGWVFFVAAAGPNPVANGRFCMEEYYFGPKSPAGQDFMQACDGFEDRFRKPFAREKRQLYALLKNDSEPQSTNNTPTPPLSHSFEPASAFIPDVWTSQPQSLHPHHSSPPSRMHSVNHQLSQPPSPSPGIDSSVDNQPNPTLDLRGLYEIPSRSGSASPFQATSKPYFQSNAFDQSFSSSPMMPARTSPRKRALYCNKGPTLSPGTLDSDLDPNRPTGGFGWMNNSPLSSNLLWGCPPTHTTSVTNMQPASLMDELNDAIPDPRRPVGDHPAASHSRLFSATGSVAFPSLNQFDPVHQDRIFAAAGPASDTNHATANTPPHPSSTLLSTSTGHDYIFPDIHINNGTPDAPQMPSVVDPFTSPTTHSAPPNMASPVGPTTNGQSGSPASSTPVTTPRKPMTATPTTTTPTPASTSSTILPAAPTAQAKNKPIPKKRKKQDNTAPPAMRRSGRATHAPRRPDETPPRKPTSTASKTRKGQ